MNSKLFPGILTVGLILWGLSSEAALYVALDGANNSPYAGWSDAATSVQAAIDQAVSGDTIYIKRGTYTNFTSELSISNKNLTILGGYEGIGLPGAYTNDRSATVLSRTAAARFRIFNIQKCTTGSIERLTIMSGYPADNLNGGGVNLSMTTNAFVNCDICFNNRYGTAGFGAGMAMSNSSVTLVGCKIRQNWANKTVDGGGIGQSGGSLLMDSCEINGNECEYSVAGSGGGIYTTGAGSTRLFNCLIANNMGRTSGGAVKHASTGTMTIENCTVVGNSPDGIYRAAGTLIVSNSIAWHNRIDLTGTVTVAYSCIENGGHNGVNGCISADPQFVDGYYLASGSPCKNSGGDTAANVGLNGQYAEPDSFDTGTVDMGRHQSTNVVYREFWVSTTGNDANPGTAGAPFRTITNALAQGSYLNINLAAGSYTNGSETFPLRIKNDGIRLLGAATATTIIDAGGASTFVIYSDPVTGIVISNLTVTGGAGSYGHGLLLDGTSIDVLDCVVCSNSTTANPTAGGAIYLEGGDVRLTRCDLFANSAYGGAESGGAGIWMQGGYASLVDCKIRQNSVTHSKSQGAGVFQIAGDLTLTRCIVCSNLASTAKGAGIARGGVAANHYGDTRLVNCLVFGNKAASGGGIYSDGMLVGNETIENCTIVTNSPDGVFLTNAATVAVTNSILWSNSDDIKNTGSTITLGYSNIGDGDNNGVNGCISRDPLFVDTTYYHLKSKTGNYTGGYFDSGIWSTSTTNSPCIDAGDPDSYYGTEPIPNGQRINMGAYGNTSVASKSMAIDSGGGLIFRFY